MKVCAVIPVKSTSSRIRSKNITLLANKPLFIHTLDKLLKISIINEVWIDTDDINIVELAYNYGCKNFKYFIRDKKYADNNTDGNLLLKNEIDNIDGDIYLQILCTSPFLSVKTIENAISLLLHNETQNVVACFSEKFYLWNGGHPLYDINNIPNSINLDDTVVEAMCLYGITKKEFVKCGYKRVSTNPYIINIEGDEIIDINFHKDFVFANKIAIFNKMNENMYFNLLKLKLNSCVFSDLLNEMGYKNQILSNYYINNNNFKLFGRARTIQIRMLELNENANDIYNCLESYNNVTNGDIIFVNNLVNKHAYFGDLNATISISKGAQGTIVNGTTRDISRTLELQYPVFYKSNSCKDVKNVGTLDFYDKPIVINDVTIYVNNLIFADIDGIVIIPKEIEYDIINKAIKNFMNENRISNALINNENISQIISKFGTF
jgi:CMP-N-acetylneuraminic acid synthetase/regulator of RNase E activity RraA